MKSINAKKIELDMENPIAPSNETNISLSLTVILYLPLIQLK